MKIIKRFIVTFIVILAILIVLPFALFEIYYNTGLSYLDTSPRDTRSLELSEFRKDIVWISLHGRGERRSRAITLITYFNLICQHVKAHKNNEASNGLQLYSVAGRLYIRDNEYREQKWNNLFFSSVLYISRNWHVDDTIVFILDNWYFGNGITGFEEASLHYYNKHYSNLSNSEFAALVVLLQSSLIVNDVEKHHEKTIELLNLVNKEGKTEWWKIHEE